MAIVPERAISEAITQQIVDAKLAGAFPDIDIVWPNKDQPVYATRPYVTIQHQRGARTDANLKGGSPVSEGFILFTVVSEKDAFATEGEQLCDEIMTAFAPRTELPFVGGKAVIGDNNMLTAFPDDVSWRTPLRVAYKAHKA